MTLPRAKIIVFMLCLCFLSMFSCCQSLSNFILWNAVFTNHLGPLHNYVHFLLVEKNKNSIEFWVAFSLSVVRYGLHYISLLLFALPYTETQINVLFPRSLISILWFFSGLKCFSELYRILFAQNFVNFLDIFSSLCSIFLPEG